MPAAPRICSLLPSATEIVCALGLADSLVGVTHECDYPPEVTSKPRVTSSVIDSVGLSSHQIDAAVRDSLEQQATIYHLDAGLLDDLQPDLILTQELCDVCAVGPDEVRQVVGTLRVQPRVVSLEPTSLDGVFESLLLVGRLTGRLRAALEVVVDLRRRLEAVTAAVADRPVRAVLTLEWIDPVFAGGHWVPEMVAIAGGRDVLGMAGRPSRQVEWKEALATQPDCVIAMPCGFGLERSQAEMRTSRFPRGWSDLPAVRGGEVYVVDGSSYFNRPGPRLVDGVEILASILHPEAFSRAPHESFARFDTPANVPS
jgi:iron complex transport system substrate-binding protein